jgi:hypothetical protein
MISITTNIHTYARFQKPHHWLKPRFHPCGVLSIIFCVKRYAVEGFGEIVGRVENEANPQRLKASVEAWFGRFDGKFYPIFHLNMLAQREYAGRLVNAGVLARRA